MMQRLKVLWTTVLGPLLEPWQTIGTRRLNFLAWVLGLSVLGLAGFWLPLALAWARGNPLTGVLGQLLYGGTLASFSVAILAEGVLGLLTVEKAGSNAAALAIRGMAGVFSLGLIIFLAGIMACEVPATSGPHVATWVHVALALLALVTASYLYCFRFPSWEKGVEDAKNAEDNEVEGLSTEAARTESDGEVKL